MRVKNKSKKSKSKMKRKKIFQNRVKKRTYGLKVSKCTNQK